MVTGCMLRELEDLEKTDDSGRGHYGRRPDPVARKLGLIVSIQMRTAYIFQK
jgi:hypothetical protein